MCKWLFSVTKPQVHQHLSPFGKILKDENKHYGAVDEFHRNNSFVNRTQLLLLYEKSGAILLVLVGLMAGRPAGQQSDKILVDFKILKILYRSHH